jgi:ABC-2 type transport system permease protein
MSLSNIAVIIWREFKSYFTTAYGYVVLTLFLLMTSIMFIMGLLDQVNRSIQDTTIIGQINYSGFFFIAIFVGPILTMKAFAEEKKIGTIELLWTSPVNTIDVVIGKYFAAVLMWLLALIMTISYPIFLNVFAQTTEAATMEGTISGIDNLMIFGQYLGIFLLGAGILAVGVFTSSITKEPFVALLSAVVLGFLLYISYFFGVQGTSPEEQTFLQTIVVNWTLYPHTQDFLQGKLYLKHIIFYVLWITFFLSLSIFALNSHKWK